MITHQQQPDDRSCASAVIAMVLCRPVDQVVAEFHKDYFEHRVTIRQFLQRHGVHLKRLAVEDGLYDDGLYLALVPSLNKLATMHSMLVHVVNDGDIVVYDPNAGRLDRRYYVSPFAKHLTENEQAMQGYVLTDKVTFSPVLGIFP